MRKTELLYTATADWISHSHKNNFLSSTTSCHFLALKSSLTSCLAFILWSGLCVKDNGTYTTTTCHHCLHTCDMSHIKNVHIVLSFAAT